MEESGLVKIETGKNWFYLLFAVWFGAFGAGSAGLLIWTAQYYVLIVSVVFILISAFFFRRIYEVSKTRKDVLRFGVKKICKAVDWIDDPTIEVNGIMNVIVVFADPDNPEVTYQSPSMRGPKGERLLHSEVPVYVYNSMYFADVKSAVEVR